MNKDKITHFKNKLTEELNLLEKELKTVGRRNPSNPNDWEATPPRGENDDSADKNIVADKIEDYETNTAILKDLEIRFNEVKKALEKIEKGVYGICEITGEKIEEDRLEANPAARTCKSHLNSKL